MPYTLNSISPFLTAAATVGIVWVAYWQWDALVKTDDTSKAINRAFVRGRELQISQDGVHWWFHPMLENVGNTQAKNAKVFVDWKFSLDPGGSPFSPPDPESVPPPKGQIFPVSPLGPKDSAYAGGGLGLPVAYIDEMAAKRADGYVYGVVWYDDVFKNSARHKSKFCYVVQPYKGPETTKVDYGLCQYWNCSDDECDEQKQEYDKRSAGLSKPAIARAP